MPPIINSHPSEAIFTGTAQWGIPHFADRYTTKKFSGSSDTRHQEDEHVT